jgi:hypothetical protein
MRTVTGAGGWQGIRDWTKVGRVRERRNLTAGANLTRERAGRLTARPCHIYSKVSISGRLATSAGVAGHRRHRDGCHHGRHHHPGHDRRRLRRALRAGEPRLQSGSGHQLRLR